MRLNNGRVHVYFAIRALGAGVVTTLLVAPACDRVEGNRQAQAGSGGVAAGTMIDPSNPYDGGGGTSTGGTIATDGGTPPAECSSFQVTRAAAIPDPLENTEAVAKVAELDEAQRIRLMYGWANCSYSAGDQCFTQQAQPAAGIPAWALRDGPRGVRTMGAFPSTSFPVSMARAASFDLDLERRIGAAVAEEMWAFKYDILLAPTINVLRHPGWGRAQETYGEDPVLLGEMGAAFIVGLQSGGIPACVKHFAANNTEDNRTTVTANMDEQTLRENYTRQFEIVVNKSDPACFMASYNRVNGVYAAENPHLLTDLLRTEWGWHGMVLSDWGATKSTAPSVNAGLDLEMPDDTYFRSLPAAIQAGDVSTERVIQAVQRTLNIRYHFGQMASDYQNRAQNLAIVDSDTHRSLAQQAAEEGMVLLRNSDGILPLAAGQRILVAGPDASTAHLGDFGSSQVDPKQQYVVSPLAGIQASADQAGATVTSATSLAAAVAAAPDNDVVILIVSMVHQDEGEGYNMGGDRDNLALSGPHPINWQTKPAQWIQDLAAANPNLVVVLNVASAIVEPALDQAKGLLYSFYPGQAGGTALGRLLFGELNFSGKLPFTIAESETDYPSFGNSGASADYAYLHGYRKFDGEGLTPKFHFGYGISYTTYEYANLRVACTDGISRNGLLVAEVDVTNTGSVAGTEVVELYIGYPNTAVRRPPKELKTFARVELGPGETKTVQLTVPAQDMAYYDEASGWSVETVEHELLVGPSSDPATLLRLPFAITN